MPPATRKQFDYPNCDRRPVDDTTGVTSPYITPVGIHGTNMTTKSQIQHAWAACEEPLQRAMHNAGADKIADPAELLQLIKSLAVKRRNNLINIIELQRIGQQSVETIKTYSASLNGQADLCDLFVTCNTCQEDVSFKEKTTMYQLIRSLADVQAQERIMEAAAQVKGGELSLNRVLKLAEAFEMGKSSQELVNSAGQILCIYEHRLKKQDNSRQNNKKNDKPTQCSNCGKRDHSSQLSVRRTKCPAFSETCSKCGVVGHYGAKCKNSKRKDNANNKNKPQVAAVETAPVATTTPPTETAELGTLSGSWFLLNGHYTFSKFSRDPQHYKGLQLTGWGRYTGEHNINVLQTQQKVPHFVFTNNTWV